MKAVTLYVVRELQVLLRYKEQVQEGSNHVYQSQCRQRAITMPGTTVDVLLMRLIESAMVAGG